MRAFKRGRALLALALGLGCATGALGQTYNITSIGSTTNPGWVIGPINYPTVGVHGEEEVRFGPAVLSGTDSHGHAISLETWCIDMFDPLQAGTFTATDIAHSGYDAAKLDLVATFLEHADPLAVDPTSAAAVQLGVWEILYENSGHWDGGTGTLYTARLPAVAALANTWLDALARKDWQPDPSLRLEVLVPGGINQAQVRLVNLPRISAVPEPASWTLMVGGFGLAGFMVRRRKVTFALAA